MRNIFRKFTQITHAKYFYHKFLATIVVCERLFVILFISIQLRIDNRFLLMNDKLEWEIDR